MHYQRNAAPHNAPLLFGNALKLPNRTVVIASVRGGDQVECLWDASAVVASAGGKVLAEFGNDAEFPVVARSSIKPLHAAMLLETMREAKGRGEAVPMLAPEEWAVVCASHSGTEAHVRNICSVMEKFGLTESNLVTGTHPPLDKVTNERLIREGKAPEAVHHQCSGHHAGLLALAKMKGWAKEDYSDPEGALQRFIRQDLQRKSNDARIRLVRSDGCNIPTWGIPMATYAKLFAQLVAEDRYKPVVDGMTRHPDLVGDADRIDGWLMKVSGGRLVAKMGNDGLICVAKRPERTGEDAKGMVFKLWQGNGNSDPMRDKTVIKALEDLGWLKPNEVKTLRALPQFALQEYSAGGALKGQVKVAYHLRDLPWRGKSQDIRHPGRDLWRDRIKKCIAGLWAAAVLVLGRFYSQ